jgi:hypothetical protein
MQSTVLRRAALALPYNGAPAQLHRILLAGGERVLRGHHMRPPELGQHVKACAPVCRVARDMVQRGAVGRPHKHIAPLPVEHLHQALHLRPRAPAPRLVI